MSRVLCPWLLSAAHTPATCAWCKDEAAVEARLVFLGPDSAELEWAWGRLEAAQGDRASPNKAYGGEVWQYMGTVEITGGWEHQFRHRAHPSDNQRRYWRVTARTGFAPPA